MPRGRDLNEDSHVVEWVKGNGRDWIPVLDGDLFCDDSDEELSIALEMEEQNREDE